MRRVITADSMALMSEHRAPLMLPSFLLPPPRSQNKTGPRGTDLIRRIKLELSYVATERRALTQAVILYRPSLCSCCHDLLLLGAELILPPPGRSILASLLFASASLCLTLCASARGNSGSWCRDAAFMIGMQKFALRLHAAPTLGLPMPADHDAPLNVACVFRLGLDGVGVLAIRGRIPERCCCRFCICVIVGSLWVEDWLEARAERLLALLHLQGLV